MKGLRPNVPTRQRRQPSARSARVRGSAQPQLPWTVAFQFRQQEVVWGCELACARASQVLVVRRQVVNFNESWGKERRRLWLGCCFWERPPDTGRVLIRTLHPCCSLPDALTSNPCRVQLQHFTRLWASRAIHARVFMSHLCTATS